MVEILPEEIALKTEMLRKIELTQAEYDALPEKDPNTLYIITDAQDANYVSEDQIGAANGIASLDSNGKVPSTQLPAMNYIPNSEKGVASGVASLGTDGKVPTEQMPSLADYGAAPTVHTHTKSQITDFPSTMTPSAHNHSASDINSGTLSVARGGSGKSSWTANRLIYPSASTTMNQLAFPSTAGSFLRQGTSGAPYWTKPADVLSAIGAVGASHEQAASSITAGTLGGKVQANATAAATVTAAQVRDIYAGTDDMAAGTTALTTGTLYFVYE